MKRIIFIILLCSISTISYSQQWVLDEIADERRDLGPSPFDGLLGMFLLFGIIWFLGKIADSWKQSKENAKNAKIRIERGKKEKIELEKREKVLRANAIPSPIDLGLSVKWANFNIGAYKPNDLGDTFYWAENCPSKRGYPQHNKKNTNQIGNISGKKDYDAATNIYGGKWRLPTDVECNELIEKCIWRLEKIDGVEGYIAIGPNGNSIFLPFTEKNYGEPQPSSGHYWSSCPSFRRAWYESAQSIRFEKKSGVIELNVSSTAARCLFTIRPVYGDLVSEEESKSIALSAFNQIQESEVNNLAELYEMFEKQSYIRDEERKDIPIPGGMLFDKTKTYLLEVSIERNEKQQ